MRVIDDEGTVYEATYPKRARGLVKSGRARFVNEHTICLARPAIQDAREAAQPSSPRVMEDAIMEESNVDYIPAVEEQPSSIGMHPDKLLERIDRIMADTAYLHEAIETIGSFGDVTGPGVQLDTRPQAIGALVSGREATNQKVLALLEKMYDDMRPDKPITEQEALNLLLDHMKDPRLPEDVRFLLATSLQQRIAME